VRLALAPALRFGEVRLALALAPALRFGEVRLAEAVLGRRPAGPASADAGAVSFSLCNLFNKDFVCAVFASVKGLPDFVTSDRCFMILVLNVDLPGVDDGKLFT